MSDELVTVEMFDNIYEADLAKLHLENEGIDAFLDDSNIVASDWFLSNAVGNIKLQVPAADAERAMRILSEDRPSFTMKGEAGLPDDDKVTCLRCGAEMPDDQDTCPQCGWSYDADDTTTPSAPNENE